MRYILGRALPLYSTPTTTTIIKKLLFPIPTLYVGRCDIFIFHNKLRSIGDFGFGPCVNRRTKSILRSDFVWTPKKLTENQPDPPLGQTKNILKYRLYCIQRPALQHGSKEAISKIRVSGAEISSEMCVK